MSRRDFIDGYLAAYSMLSPQTNPDTRERDAETAYRRAQREQVLWDDPNKEVDLPILPYNGAKMIVAISSHEMSTGSAVRLCIPGHKPAAKALCVMACDPGHEDAVGFFLAYIVPTKTDHETGWPLGYVQFNKETASQFGTRVHKHIENRIKAAQPNHLLDGPDDDLVIDEEDWDLKNLPPLTNGKPTWLPSWRCDGYQCPERAPVLAEAPPKCYTCDKPMAMVAKPGDLAADRAGNVAKNEMTVAELAKKLGVSKKSDLGAWTAMLTGIGGAGVIGHLPPLPFKSTLPDPIYRAEPPRWDEKAANEWFEARKRWRAGITVDLLEQPQSHYAWTLPPGWDPHTARGDELDTLCRLTAGMLRRDGAFGDDDRYVHPETDDELRERLLRVLPPRHDHAIK